MSFVPILLLRVAATWPLPGLGLLALPAGSTPHLLPYALHTALAVLAIGPDGERHVGTATVEEVTQPGASDTPVRSLLLDFGAPIPLSPNTEIWLHDSEPLLDGTEF
jgi:hypothetical protein